MSDAFVIRENVVVKRRNPWIVLGLSVLTLGVYLPIWYYKVNRELRDYGEKFAVPPLDDNPLEVKPLVAALAISPLSFLLLFIPIPVSTYRTMRRVERAEELAGSPKRISPSVVWLYLLIGVTAMFIWAVYLQYHVNALWDTCRRAEPATEPVTEPGLAAKWLTDPSGRHEYRFWNGSAWSEHVSDRGHQMMDPLTPPQAATPQQPQAEDVKTCPDCSEEIKAAALVCRYCGHHFAPAEESGVLVTSGQTAGSEDQ